MPMTRRETYSNGQLVSVDEVWTSDETVNEQTLIQRANDALAALRTIANGSGSMSNAQLSDAARTIARALLALARLYLRRLESTD